MSISSLAWFAVLFFIGFCIASGQWVLLCIGIGYALVYAALLVAEAYFRRGDW